MYEAVPFRFIVGNLHPDHDTLAAFRRTFLPELKNLFAQVLLLAQEAGVLKLGTISLDVRRRSTGEVIKRDRKGDSVWTRFAFPTWWHYDVLRGLEYLRRAGVAPDERVAEAIDLVASKRGSDGRWPLETWYPGKMPVETDEGEGQPSR